MKIAVIFYSFSGDTRSACLFLKDKLTNMGQVVDIYDLKLQKEVKSFFCQCLEARKKTSPALVDTNYAVNSYEYIIFASPVWAFTFTPALRTYLNNVEGLENKKVGCFLTYGSGTGSKNALKELEDIIRDKKGRIIFSKNFKGAQVKKPAYLEEQFSSLLGIIR